jgi:hypothetical protein
MVLGKSYTALQSYTTIVEIIMIIRNGIGTVRSLPLLTNYADAYKFQQEI